MCSQTEPEPGPPLNRKVTGRGGAPGVGSRATPPRYNHGGARAAAGEITTAAVSLSVGALVFHQMTPGLLTLGLAH